MRTSSSLRIGIQPSSSAGKLNSNGISQWNFSGIELEVKWVLDALVDYVVVVDVEDVCENC